LLADRSAKKDLVKAGFDEEAIAVAQDAHSATAIACEWLATLARLTRRHLEMLTPVFPGSSNVTKSLTTVCDTSRSSQIRKCLLLMRPLRNRH
jgi:hypothetical protein